MKRAPMCVRHGAEGQLADRALLLLPLPLLLLLLPCLLRQLLPPLLLHHELLPGHLLGGRNWRHVRWHILTRRWPVRVLPGAPRDLRRRLSQTWRPPFGRHVLGRLRVRRVGGAGQLVRGQTRRVQGWRLRRLPSTLHAPCGGKLAVARKFSGQWASKRRTVCGMRRWWAAMRRTRRRGQCWCCVRSKKMTPASNMCRLLMTRSIHCLAYQETTVALSMDVPPLHWLPGSRRLISDPTVAAGASTGDDTTSASHCRRRVAM
mmetsp:Transcript_66226/g.204908  ORF Transcript_66226/g.204908 Transcript_66226/m.204908 type:complete len:261 (+) Transcript_66226:1-783(+)